MNSKIRNINGNNEETGLEDEINDIRMERGKKDIDKVTEGWVKDWLEKGQKNTDTDDRSRERKEYILNSLAETDSEMNNRTLPVKSARQITVFKVCIACSCGNYRRADSDKNAASLL